MRSCLWRLVVSGCAMIALLALIPLLGSPPDARAGDQTAGGEALVFLPEDATQAATTMTELGFPFQNVRDLAEIRAFGIAPWGGEPVHNGIDLIVDKARLAVGDIVPVRSPVDGIVVDVRELVNEFELDPALRQWILVVIEVEPTLWVALSFEAKGASEELQQAQRDSISVVSGQVVRQGQRIGGLVVGEGSGTVGSGLPHVDYRLVLKEASTTLDQLLESGASHDNKADLPTFLCAYEYSSPQAKRRFDRVLSRADSATQCQCACKSPDRPATCGSGCID